MNLAGFDLFIVSSVLLSHADSRSTIIPANVSVASVLLVTLPALFGVHCAKTVIFPVTGVADVKDAPEPFAAVFQPEKLCPSLVIVGSVPTVVAGVVTCLIWVAGAPPFPLKVTVYVTLAVAVVIVALAALIGDASRFAVSLSLAKKVFPVFGVSPVNVGLS